MASKLQRKWIEQQAEAKAKARAEEARKARLIKRSEQKKAKWNREVAALERDFERVAARAAELASGSPLRFSQAVMARALDAFVEATESWHRDQGDTRDYLNRVPVRRKPYGSAWCETCAQHFSSDRKWAFHMMSEAHTFKRAGVEPMREVRAHIQAFPMASDDFDSYDTSRILKNYHFRNLPAHTPAPAVEEAVAPGGESSAPD